MNFKVLVEHFTVLLSLQKDLRLGNVAIVNTFQQQNVSVI
jgi:hypothetical protein